MIPADDYDLIPGIQSLRRAKYGDLSVLLERLRSGARLLDEERHLLADLVEGKIRLPPNRASSLAIEVRNEDMIYTYLVARDGKLFSAPAQFVARDFGVSSTHLHRIHRQLKAEADRYARIQKRAEERCDLYRSWDEEEE